MSDQTREALEKAIADHIRDESGDDAGAWVVVAETTDFGELQDETTSWFVATKAFQSGITTTGLLYSAIQSGASTVTKDDDA